MIYFKKKQEDLKKVRESPAKKASRAMLREFLRLEDWLCWGGCLFLSVLPLHPNCSPDSLGWYACNWGTSSMRWESSERQALAESFSVAWAKMVTEAVWWRKWMCLILEDGTSATCLRCASSAGVGLASTMGPADLNCLVGMISCVISGQPV